MKNVYLVPQEIKSETKIFSGIYLLDLFIIVVVAVSLLSLANKIDESLTFFYYAFAIILPVILTRPVTKLNPKKRLFQSIAYALMVDKKTYHAIYKEEKNEQTNIRK
ncbi:MAG: DUF5592 family protein [Anaerovoracaceae bacterium]